TRSHMTLSKWQALGNDYLLVERAELPEPLTPDRVRHLCDYHYGVGSDGLLEVVQVEGTHAEVRIWNPDGSTAELSGNGVRIVAAWLARESQSEQVTLSIGPRHVEAIVRDGEGIEVDVGRVEVGETETLDLDDERVEFTPVSVGNPHAVVRREPERGELRRLGPRIERHSRFPERTGRHEGAMLDGLVAGHVDDRDRRGQRHIRPDHGARSDSYAFGQDRARP